MDVTLRSVPEWAGVKYPDSDMGDVRRVETPAYEDPGPHPFSPGPVPHKATTVKIHHDNVTKLNGQRLPSIDSNSRSHQVELRAKGYAKP